MLTDKGLKETEMAEAAEKRKDEGDMMKRQRVEMAKEKQTRSRKAWSENRAMRNKAVI